MRSAWIRGILEIKIGGMLNIQDCSQGPDEIDGRMAYLHLFFSILKIEIEEHITREEILMKKFKNTKF